MTTTKDQIALIEKFSHNVAKKMQEIITDEIEVDVDSLYEWFMDYAIAQKLDCHALHCFEKIFAQLMIFKFMTEEGSIIEADTPEQIEKIKEFSIKNGGRISSSKKRSGE